MVMSTDAVEQIYRSPERGSGSREPVLKMASWFRQLSTKFLVDRGMVEAVQGIGWACLNIYHSHCGSQCSRYGTGPT